MIKLVILSIISILVSLNMYAFQNIDLENTKVKTVRLLIEISPGRYTMHNIQVRVPKNHSKDLYFTTRNLISEQNNLISVKLFSNLNREIILRSYSNCLQSFELWNGSVETGENNIKLKLPGHLQGISFISIELDGHTIDIIKILSCKN